MAKSKAEIWADFLKEAAFAVESKEPIDGFMERMQDAGYDVIFTPAALRPQLEEAKEIALYFNRVCGTTYDIKRFPNHTSARITNLLKQGFSADRLKDVILMMANRFKGIALENNLRMDIIFNPDKFFNYEAQCRVQKSTAQKTNNRTQSINSGHLPQMKASFYPENTPELNMQATLELIEELSLFDFTKKKPLHLIALTAMVSQYFDKNHINLFTEENQEKATAFAKEYCKEPDSMEYYRKYYLLKKLIKEKGLPEIKAMVSIDHFKGKTQ